MGKWALEKHARVLKHSTPLGYCRLAIGNSSYAFQLFGSMWTIVFIGIYGDASHQTMISN